MNPLLVLVIIGLFWIALEAALAARGERSISRVATIRRALGWANGLASLTIYLMGWTPGLEASLTPALRVVVYVFIILFSVVWGIAFSLAVDWTIRNKDRFPRR